MDALTIVCTCLAAVMSVFVLGICVAFWTGADIRPKWKKEMDKRAQERTIEAVKETIEKQIVPELEKIKREQLEMNADLFLLADLMNTKNQIRDNKKNINK